MSPPLAPETVEQKWRAALQLMEDAKRRLNMALASPTTVESAMDADIAQNCLRMAVQQLEHASSLYIARASAKARGSTTMYTYTFERGGKLWRAAVSYDHLRDAVNAARAAERGDTRNCKVMPESEADAAVAKARITKTKRK